MTTLKLGYTNPLNDSFGAHPQLGAVLDLNDGQVFALVSPDGLELAPPPKTLVPSGNICTQGERITRSVYRHNREAVVRLILGPGASYASLIASVRNLLAWVNAAPAVPVTLQWQPPSALAPVYLDVVGAACDISSDEGEWLGLQFEPLEVVFLCRPGLRGDRVVLANAVSNPGFEAPGGPVVNVFTDPFANVAAYAVQGGGAPSVASNVMTIPSGTTLTFGSPAWGAINRWQVRWKYNSSLTEFDFLLHRTDASNYLYVWMNTTSVNLAQLVGGTFHSIAGTATALTNGTFYWLTVTQFPSVPGNPPYLVATLKNDSAGAVGTQVATISGVPFDAVTAMAGVAGFIVSGAPLLIGGAFAGVHTLSLFGPGGWLSTNFTGVGAYAWDGTRAELGMSGTATAGTQTYGGGPVTSAGAARVDFPPSGTVNVAWTNFLGGSPAGTPLVPVQLAGNVVQASCYTKSAGLSASAQIALYVQEYNASGTLLRQTAVQTLTGNQASWTKLSGSVTTGANCAYVGLLLNPLDTSAPGASAAATVWFDNVQCWDQTRTGMATMPYCELSFPQSPAQLLLSLGCSAICRRQPRSPGARFFRAGRRGARCSTRWRAGGNSRPRARWCRRGMGSTARRLRRRRVGCSPPPRTGAAMRKPTRRMRLPSRRGVSRR